MRRWVIAAAVMILVPWAVSLAWMRSAGIQAEAAGISAPGGQARDGEPAGNLDGAGSRAGKGSKGGETGSKIAGDSMGREKGEEAVKENRGNGTEEEGEEDGTNEEGMALEAGNVAGSRGKKAGEEGKADRKILVERKGIRTYIDLEDYLPGVMVCQMDGDYEMEALKCQAVIARTYMYRLMDGREEIYEEELDMDYLGEGEGSLLGDRMKLLGKLKRCQEAAEATRGVVMKYEDRYLLPLFHGMSAGRTRTGDLDFPYLQSAESVADTKRDDYMQVLELSRGSFAAAISQIPGSPGVTADQLPAQIQTVKKDDAGYMVEMKIGAGTYSGDEIWSALGLMSPCFSVEGDGDVIRVRVRGRGHGYGLSQAGADSMAKEGWGYEEILNHYYKNISLISE